MIKQNTFYSVNVYCINDYSVLVNNKFIITIQMVLHYPYVNVYRSCIMLYWILYHDVCTYKTQVCPLNTRINMYIHYWYTYYLLIQVWN